MPGTRATRDGNPGTKFARMGKMNCLDLDCSQHHITSSMLFFIIIEFKYIRSQNLETMQKKSPFDHN